MQYQVFVKNQSDQHFVASVIGMPTIAVDWQTEAEAISNVKIALESQLATGKVVTILFQRGFCEGKGSANANEIDQIETKSKSTPAMKYAGVFENDPTFDDWMEKLAEIRRIANEVED